MLFGVGENEKEIDVVSVKKERPQFLRQCQRRLAKYRL